MIAQPTIAKVGGIAAGAGDGAAAPDLPGFASSLHIASETERPTTETDPVT